MFSCRTETSPSMHLPQIYHLDRSKSGPRRVGPSQGWGWWSNRKMLLPIGDGSGTWHLLCIVMLEELVQCEGIMLPNHFHFDVTWSLILMWICFLMVFDRSSGVLGSPVAKRISKHETQSAWLRFIPHATSCGKVPARWTCIPQAA